MQFKKLTKQKRTTLSLITYYNNIVRSCEIALDIKKKNLKLAHMRRY